MVAFVSILWYCFHQSLGVLNFTTPFFSMVVGVLSHKPFQILCTLSMFKSKETLLHTPFTHAVGFMREWDVNKPKKEREKMSSDVHATDNEDLVASEDELMSLLKEITNSTLSTKKLKGRQRMKQIDIIRDRIRRAREVIKEYKGMND